MDQCKCVRETREGEATDLAKCPFCGSEAKGPTSTRWLCGTVMPPQGPRQSDTCRIRELEARLVVDDLTVVDLNCDVEDLKAKVAEKEAEVAARAARCALLLECIAERVENLSAILDDATHGRLWEGELASQLHSEIGELADAVKVPDLAASRLLAAGALAEACRDKPPRAIAGPGLHCCWFCGADYSHKDGCLFVAYGEAVAAEGEADG